MTGMYPLALVSNITLTRLVDMPELWIPIPPTRQPTGRNLRPSILTLTGLPQNLSRHDQPRDEGRIRNLNPHHFLVLRQHLPTLHLFPTASKSLKALAQKQAITAKLPTHPRPRLLYLRISNLTVVHRDPRVRGKSLWEVECRLFWERREVGPS